MAAAGDAAGPAPQTVADATHDLYRQYGKQIYAYCLHQLRSREEAEDAVQTTFLNAFRGLQRGTTTRFEQAWLYKIAQNVCIERRSSSGRRLRLEHPDDFEILQEVVPSSAAAEGDTLELMGLDAALDSMPENQRRAILMREWQGMSYREISTELGVTQGAVEMLIFRARRALAHALEEPAAETKHAGRARTGFSLGSLIAAMKPLLSTGAAVKMAAVAVSAAVVTTNGVVHSVISQAGKPAPKRVVATAHRRAASVRTFTTASPAVPVTTRRKVVTRPAMSPVTVHVQETRRPVIPVEVDALAPPPDPAATPTPAPAPAPEPEPEPTVSRPTTDPPTHAAAPAPQQAAAPAPAPPAPTPVEQTTGPRGGRHHGDKTWSTWNLPLQSSDDTTTTTTTTTTTVATVTATTTTTTAPATTTTATTTTATTTTPAQVTPDPVVAAVTTTSTLPSAPPATQPQPQPTPPPPPVSFPRGGWHGNGDHDGWGNEGGGRGHH